MKLDELHVDQFRTRFIGEGETVAGRFPTVARDLVGAAQPAGRKHDRFGPKDFETAALTLVAKRADDAPALFQQGEDCVLHINLDALMNAVILQRANHFQTRAIANMRETRVSVAAEIPLQNAPILRAI